MAQTTPTAETTPTPPQLPGRGRRRRPSMHGRARDGVSPMTTGADTLPLADETGANETSSSVRAIRSFVRGRRRRSWLDLYAIGFAIVIGCIYASDLLTAPFSRLSGAAASAGGQY